MKVIRVLFLCLAALAAVPVMAQQKTDDTNMQILLEKIKADKKLVVAAGMNLTEPEAKGFWPIYEGYQKDLQAVNDRLERAILAYADAYNKKTLTDAQAMQLATEALSIDQDELTLRKTYAARLTGVISGIKVARHSKSRTRFELVIRVRAGGWYSVGSVNQAPRSRTAQTADRSCGTAPVGATTTADPSRVLIEDPQCSERYRTCSYISPGCDDELFARVRASICMSTLIPSWS